MKNIITVTIDGKKIAVDIPDRLIRDWFAGQALAASDWASWEQRPNLSQEIADRCYGKAEAMMAVRSKP